MNVLLVSSQFNFLAEGLQVLTENGFVIHVQHTIEEACAASQTLTPSLVILDTDMALDDPVGACQALHDTSQAPVIVVTASEQTPAEAAACFEAGAGARLLKDVSTILLLTWAQALTRRR